MKQKLHLFLFISIMMCILLFLQKITGLKIHAMISLIFTILIIIHMIKHFKKIKHRTLSICIIDCLLIIFLIGLFISGKMVMHNDTILLVLAHKLCALLFVLSMIVHCLQHKNFFIK
jgi:hypothetical protein